MATHLNSEGRKAILAWTGIVSVPVRKELVKVIDELSHEMHEQFKNAESIDEIHRVQGAVRLLDSLRVSIVSTYSQSD